MSFYSEAWFARSTDGGQSWQPAHPIFRDRGVFTQTIGNQVEVLPDGTLINGFNLIRAVSNRQGTRGYNVALIRSPDKGDTWTRETIVDRLLSDEVHDPETGHDVRTGDILPDWAVDRSSNPATRGNVYVVWMDTRFNDADHNDILLARSANGGLSWDAPVVVDQTPRGVDAFTRDGRRRQRRAAWRQLPRLPQRRARRRCAVDRCLDHALARRRADVPRREPPDGDVVRHAHRPRRPRLLRRRLCRPDHVGTVFHPTWVGANDGNLANRTDVFHRTAG